MATYIPPPQIVQLSEDAIAKIRSTVSLTDLADTVKGLLMNSFDANATKITLFIDVAANSVTIEDDGDGIVPADVKQIGSRYATSKSQFSSKFTFGYRGEFLASLANSSYLTIFSRNRHYRSTWTTNYHYGKHIRCEQVEKDHLLLPKPGTKVIVNQLFGNYPVRRMARENLTKPQISREWDLINRKVVEVLLAVVFNGARATVIVRDRSGVRKAVFDASEEMHKERMLEKVMTQAGYGKMSWDFPLADWNGFILRAMIGLVPVANKEQQFIFVDNYPIPRGGNSVLYAKANSVFAASTFGTIDSATPFEIGKKRVPKKAVERHPSFIMFIQTAESGNTVHGEDWDMGSGSANLEHVENLIDSVIDQFLKKGGWKKEVTRKRKLDEFEVTMGEPGPEVHTRKAQKPRTRADLPGVEHLIMRNARSSDGTRGLSIGEMKSFAKKSAEKPQNTPLQPPSTPQMASNDPNIIHHFVQSLGTYVQLDARTGNQIMERPKPMMAAGRLTLLPLSGAEQRARFAANRANMDALVQRAQAINPVFRVPEKPIPRLTDSMDGFFRADGVPSKISKEALRNACVLGQVDEKLIMITTRSPEHLIVIVDQHAADERVRVERLWQDYNNQPVPLLRPQNFAIRGRDLEWFVQVRYTIEAWGFRFNITQAPGLEGLKTLEVVAAPELVADRCVSDPGLVVNLLKSWFAEASDPEVRVPIFYRAGKEQWKSRMAYASKGLVDVVNSRACRGAIMFNDVLTIAECKELMEKLAACEFPWMCAHGRPSMLPLLNLATGLPAVQVPFVKDKCPMFCSHCEVRQPGGGLE